VLGSVRGGGGSVKTGSDQDPSPAGAGGPWPGNGGAPPAVAAASAAGAAATTSKSDHTHAGVATVQTLTGAVTVQLRAANLAVGTSGQNVIIGGSANALADAANWLTRTAWSVDPSNSTGLASDSNTGADATHPLLTMAECAGRIYGNRYAVGSPCFVTVMSDMLAGQSAYFNTVGVGAPGGTLGMPFANAFLNIVGTPTVIYTGTGTMTAPAQTALGAAGDNHFTDAAAPAFVTANRLWKRTNGTVAYFWPVKDLTGGVWGISQPASGSNQATLAGGDSWQILQLPVVRNLQFAPTADRLQYSVALCNEASTSTQQRMSARVFWQVCQFTSTSPILLGQDLYNCCDFQARFASAPGGWSGTTIVRGGLARGTMALPNSGCLTFAASANLYTCVSAGSITTDVGTNLAEGHFAFYDTTTTMFSMVRSLGRIWINSLGGARNTGQICNIAGAGAVAVFSSTGPPAAGITTNATPYQVKATAAAGPPIVDTTVLSEIVSDV
jgi:hypothetical protein